MRAARLGVRAARRRAITDRRGESLAARHAGGNRDRIVQAVASARPSLGTAWRRSTTGAPPYIFLLIHVESAESI